jgi:hypothetical protein
MKAKTLAVLATAVLLSMSVAANAEECNKFGLEMGSGKYCLPYSLGGVTIGSGNLYADAAIIGGVACAMFPHRVCKVVKPFSYAALGYRFGK